MSRLDEVEKFVAELTLKNYPQREFTHEFLTATIRSAWLAGYDQGSEDASDAAFHDRSYRE